MLLHGCNDVPSHIFTTHTSRGDWAVTIDKRQQWNWLFASLDTSQMATAHRTWGDHSTMLCRWPESGEVLDELSPSTLIVFEKHISSTQV